MNTKNIHMNVKEGLQKIKALFDAMPAPVAAPVAAAAPPPPPAAPAPTAYTLADGTAVSIDTLAVGGMVTIAGAMAPDAEYILADGTSITTVGGVITELESAAAEAAEPTEAAPALMAEMKADFSKQSNTIAALTAQVSAQKEIVKELFALVEILGKEEAAAPTEPAKEWDKMTSLEKFRATK